MSTLEELGRDEWDSGHQKMSGTSPYGSSQHFKFIPAVVDGTFLPRDPQELLAFADFQPVPSIIGVNNNEFGWLLPLVRPKLPGARPLGRGRVGVGRWERVAGLRAS